MKSQNFKIAIISLFIGFSLLIGNKVFAAGLLTPKDRGLTELTMESHDVQVTIEDGYVITQVDQVFANPHQMDLEALYTFPVPENASVAEFSIWIDGKKVTGEVLEKQQARKIYEEEKQAGRETGLTEKTKSHAFEISVFPVRATNSTKLRLVYIQPVSIDTGMGRYLYPLESGGTDEEQKSFWTANEKVQSRFSFNLNLRSSVPVDGVRVPNLQTAQIQQKNQQEWSVAIQSGLPEEGGSSPQSTAAFTLNKDIVVYWRQAPNIPGRVEMVTYKPESTQKGTFMITVTPGDDLNKITEGTDWIFILDKSGSMSDKFSTLLDGVEKALGKMSGKDRFRILFFNNNASEFTNGFVAANQQTVGDVINRLRQESVDGGTNLYAGLKQGMNLTDVDRTTSLILVTDGVANVGITEQSKFIELMKQKDLRLFTFIMGNNANSFLLKHLTSVSNGFAASVSNSDDIVGQIMSATSKVTHESLHGVKLKISGIKTSDLTTNNTGSLYRGQQLIIFGHYRGDGTAKVQLKGKISGQEKIYETEFGFPAVSSDHPEIERLWAYAKIQDLKRQMVMKSQVSELKQAIINLSKQYSIVTDYTSMLVVRDEVFEERGIKRSNKKRLEKENQAQQQRSQSAVKSRRVDNAQPMYKSSQASHSGGSGGGALNLWFTILLLPLLLLKRLSKTNEK